MQFKLLQFYKVLSNFSTSLISAFVPLLIYQETGNLYLSVLCLLLQSIANMLFTFALKKWLYEKPQLCLMLRIVPIILFQVLLVFMSKAPVWAVIGCGIFTGLNYTLKYIPSDIIFAYATPANATTKTLALSRLSEEIGYVLAGVLGGLFLDYIDYTILIIISLSLYFLGSLPLVIYYIKNRKQKSFNSEHISNAAIQLETRVNDGRGKKVTKKVLIGYAIEYLLIGGIDVVYSIFTFMVYLSGGSYFLAGVLVSVFDGVYGLSTMLVGKLDEKIDLTFYTALAGIVIGVLTIIISFTSGSILSFVAFEVIALLWPFLTIFIHQRMLQKSKILGITNDCSTAKQLGSLAGCAIGYLFGFISIPFIAVASGILTICGGVYVPMNEEETRNDLVNYLENNEI